MSLKHSRWSHWLFLANLWTKLVSFYEIHAKNNNQKHGCKLVTVVRIVVDVAGNKLLLLAHFFKKKWNHKRFREKNHIFNTSLKSKVAVNWSNHSLLSPKLEFSYNIYCDTFTIISMTKRNTNVRSCVREETRAFSLPLSGDLVFCK